MPNLKKINKYLSLYFHSFSLFWRASRLSSTLLLFLIPLQAIAPVALIKISQVMLDGLIQGNVSYQPLIIWGIIFFISSAAIPINTSLQGILTDKLIAFVNTQLMNKSKSIHGLNLFENAEFYDNLQFVSSQASWQPVNLIVFGISMIRELITVISMLILLGQYNFWIALVLLLAIIPQSIISYHIQQDSFETMVTRSPDARQMQYYSDTLLTATNAKEVRLFGMFNYFITAYKKIYQKTHQQMKKVRLRQMWVSLLFLAISTLLSIGTLVWMIHDIQSGKLPTGAFLIFISTLTATTSAVYSLIENSSLLYDTLLYMEKYFTFMHVQETNDFNGTLEFPHQLETISFNQLTFKYPGQATPALAKVSFTVKAGEQIAIVGENGSGKSTLVKLLLRFYDPQTGNITLNDTPIEKFNIQSYRQNFGAVFQDYAKFYLTIQENLNLGRPNQVNTQQKLLQALKDGGFYESFVAKKLSLNTMLGKQFAGGIDLSGGQWQKLAISRAFMPDSKILILDEPTASLDPRSEFKVYQSFIKMATDKTVFFITHRMSAVHLAQRVMVLKNGEIVGFAPHEELMKTNSYYAELYNLQAQSFQ